MSASRCHDTNIVDAMVLAARGDELSRRFAMSELPRLVELARDSASTADLHLRFHLVDGRCAIEGEVAANVRATCQRCLQPVDVEVHDRFHAVVVRNEDELKDLPEEQDSIIANPEHFDLAWLAEEQLLLAMPLVPLHDSKEACGVEEVEDNESRPQQDTHAPFANLRDLMNRQ